jgi:hypothetical protein
MAFDDDVRDKPFNPADIPPPRAGAPPASGQDAAVSAPPTPKGYRFQPGNPYRFKPGHKHKPREREPRARRMSAEQIALRLLDRTYVNKLKERLDSGHLPPALEAVILRLAFKLPEGGDEGTIADEITRRWQATR